MKGKRVLVTGGSGFIASHLVKRLLEDGSEVGITVRNADVLRNERLAPVWDKIHVIEADLRNRGALNQITDFKPNIVFHLAAYNQVETSFIQVEEVFDVNAKGTANVLDCCQKNLDCFVYTSSSEVYGQQESVPFKETMPARPISPHGITKYSGEQYCRMKQTMKNDYPIMIVRPFNTFGPYQNFKALIPELILKCLRSETIQTTQGAHTREFNYVSNIVDGLLATGSTTVQVEGPINLCSGVEVKTDDLAKKIVELTNTRSKVEFGVLQNHPNDISRMFADNTRAKETLGWSPKVTWEEGLIKTVEWFQQYVANNSAILNIAA